MKRRTFCKCITCHDKGISLVKFMHRSHKSSVTKDEWHFLFVVVFTVGFSKCGHFRETHCKDAVIFRQSVKNADLSC